MSAFEELRNKTSRERTSIGWAIMIVSEGMIPGSKEPELAEKAASQLAALEKVADILDEVNRRVPGIRYNYFDDNNVDLADRISSALAEWKATKLTTKNAKGLAKNTLEK